MLRLGVIGYGSRISGVVRLCQRTEPATRIVAITDINLEAAKKRLEERKDFNLEKVQDVHWYTDAEEMLRKEDLDGVFVGTRCSLHTTMAVKVAPTGIPLYLEKPVSTTMEDLKKLKAAFDKSTSEVVVSFPLRLTPLAQVAREVVEAGRIGAISHVQAVNNVPYGTGYFSSWYRDYNETGGLWLQKATHDFDCINYLVGQPPVLVAAMESQRVMGHGMPDITCDQCDKQEECPQSPYADFYLHGAVDHFEPKAKACAFHSDPRYHDNGSALVEYANGVHACYTQNFLTRRDAATRGATLIGYKGTIQFDWYTNLVKITSHHASRTDTVNCTSQHGHGGGDLELIVNFVNVMKGKAKSRSPISAGIMSALMCLKARTAAQTHTFQKIDLAELDS